MSQPKLHGRKKKLLITPGVVVTWGRRKTSIEVTSFIAKHGRWDSLSIANKNKRASAYCVTSYDTHEVWRNWHCRPRFHDRDFPYFTQATR